MNSSRRKFLQTGATTAALAATAGCGVDWRNPVRGFVAAAGFDSQPFQPPTAEAIDPVAHVLNRLSFGARPGDYQRVRKLGATPEEAARAYVEEQLQPEKLDDSLADRIVRRFDALDEPAAEMFEYKERFLLNQMVKAAVLRAVYSERQLYEVMVGFWTDHFNIDPGKGDCRWLKASDDRAVVRKFALGDCGLSEPVTILDRLQTFWAGESSAPKPAFNFPAMLRASALSPAMLWYLDGRSNRKANPAEKPNENYARELLELHTLGVHAGYQQKDVMEVARCLTGWTVRGKRQFGKAMVEFNQRLHDDGPKTVLGQTIPAGLGAGDLDRVLNIVALHPATAKHIATKLCRRFISDEPSGAAVATVADEFIASSGDIRATLRKLFATGDFLNARGNKFKRPFHFIVSALRATRAGTDADQQLISYLERMGHVPFHYPTPDGYPEEPGPWLGTMLWRWNFAVNLGENKIKGTRVDLKSLTAHAGGEEKLMAHLLGRRATKEERAAYHDSGAGPALCLASPAFQWC
ncbi:MAG: DUF1800 domain-containing protein [Verrucomicrobia bacterium]|nr:DUF1800 domain-containing protein [Verrucomicrobiota bacterium]